MSLIQFAAGLPWLLYWLGAIRNIVARAELPIEVVAEESRDRPTDQEGFRWTRFQRNLLLILGSSSLGYTHIHTHLLFQNIIEGVTLLRWGGGAWSTKSKEPTEERKMGRRQCRPLTTTTRLWCLVWNKAQDIGGVAFDGSLAVVDIIEEKKQKKKIGERLSDVIQSRRDYWLLVFEKGKRWRRIWWF